MFYSSRTVDFSQSDAFGLTHYFLESVADVRRDQKMDQMMTCPIQRKEKSALAYEFRNRFYILTYSNIILQYRFCTFTNRFIVERNTCIGKYPYSLLLYILHRIYTDMVVLDIQTLCRDRLSTIKLCSS